MIAYPQKDLFEIFGKHFQKQLKKINNLEIILNTKISINNSEIFFIKKDKKMILKTENVIFCSNVPFF